MMEELEIESVTGFTEGNKRNIKCYEVLRENGKVSHYDASKRSDFAKRMRKFPSLLSYFVDNTRVFYWGQGEVFDLKTESFPDVKTKPAEDEIDSRILEWIDRLFDHQVRMWFDGDLMRLEILYGNLVREEMMVDGELMRVSLQKMAHKKTS